METQLSAQDSIGDLVVISSSGRELLQTFNNDGQEMIALADLARLFSLELREDSRAGTFSILHGEDVIILTPNQQLVSVSGQLVSLQASLQRLEGRWVVSLDFLNRALVPIYEERLEFRQQNRLILIGDVHVPRISGQYRSLASDGQLTLEVSPDTPYTINREERRLIISFQADALDIERMPLPRGDLVAAFRQVETPPGLEIDLGPTFDSFVVSSTSLPRGVTGLVVDLKSRTRENSDATPSVPVESLTLNEPAVDPLPDFNMERSVRVVAIDPGHGGEDEGSQGANGQFEKNITLSVGKRLQNVLESRLGMRVIPTRASDQTVELDERAAIANNNGADLFVSLHVNASSRPSATGAEVFYLSIDEYGLEARELAQSQGELAPLIGGGSRVIDLVLWEMAQVRYVDQSAHAAKIMAEELSRRIPMGSSAVQQAPFRVLVGANMPAILVELGSISDPVDELRLTSSNFQNRVVEALVAGILRFRDYLEASSRTDRDARTIVPTTIQ